MILSLMNLNSHLIIRQAYCRLVCFRDPIFRKSSSMIRHEARWERPTFRMSIPGMILPPPQLLMDHERVFRLLRPV